MSIHPEEPPSPFGLRNHIRLTSRRNAQFIRTRLRRSLRLVRAQHPLTTAACLTPLVAITTFVVISFVRAPKAQALAADDRERVEVAISGYFDPFTIAAPPANATLTNVTVKGSAGTGGPESVSAPQTYTVQEGDTLSGIADRYDMSSGSIILANAELKGSDVIHPGQILTIPAQPATPDQLATLKKALANVPVATSASKTNSAALSGGYYSASKAKADSSYALPVRYSYESQGFSSSHPGRDMVAAYGSPIRATKSGCLISVGGGWNGGYGNLIVEDLGGGVTARYAHLSAFQKGMASGVCVSQGDVIGYLGSTGNSTGPHLHFELRRNGVAFDPNM